MRTPIAGLSWPTPNPVSGNLEFDAGFSWGPRFYVSLSPWIKGRRTWGTVMGSPKHKQVG